MLHGFVIKHRNTFCSSSHRSHCQKVVYIKYSRYTQLMSSEVAQIASNYSLFETLSFQTPEAHKMKQNLTHHIYCLLNNNNCWTSSKESRTFHLLHFILIQKPKVWLLSVCTEPFFFLTSLFLQNHELKSWCKLHMPVINPGRVANNFHSGLREKEEVISSMLCFSNYIWINNILCSIISMKIV